MKQEKFGQEMSSIGGVRRGFTRMKKPGDCFVVSYLMRMTNLVRSSKSMIDGNSCILYVILGISDLIFSLSA
jgi:hypothetical protein